MKMKHVMAALLFGVVAVGSVQAQETHYKYYPVTTEIYGEVIINTTDLDEACRLGADSYNERWIQIYSKTNQVGHGKYKQRWLDDFKNGRPIRYIMCAYQKREKNKDGSWGEWEDRGPSSFVNFSCRDGGRFLFRTKDLCAEERRGPIPEESKCDSSYYPNGIVPEDCPKTEPKIKEVVNDPMCEKITRTQNGAGAVVCDDKENFHPCIWTDHLNIQPKAAEDVIRFCFNTHEKRHIETRNRFKTNCGPTDDTDPDFGIFPNTLRGKEPSYYLDEADAYTKTVDCLADNIAYCKNDPICVKRIRDEVLVMRNKVFKSLRDYNEYCSKPENNCEQVILQIKSNLKNEKE